MERYSWQKSACSKTLVYNASLYSLRVRWLVQLVYNFCSYIANYGPYSLCAFFIGGTFGFLCHVFPYAQCNSSHIGACFSYLYCCVILRCASIAKSLYIWAKLKFISVLLVLLACLVSLELEYLLNWYYPWDFWNQLSQCTTALISQMLVLFILLYTTQ